MFLRTWRLITIVLTALSMGVALCHLLEMPAKMGYSGELWLTLLHTLYPPAFGTFGAAFEVGAVVTAAVLVLLVRRRRPAVVWTVVGALCLIAAHAAFWVWVAPVNTEMMPLTAETLPEGWPSLRAQWEYTHAARAILQLIALAALVFSVLVETPADSAPPR